MVQHSLSEMIPRFPTSINVMVAVLLVTEVVTQSVAASTVKSTKRSSERRLHDFLFRSYDPGCRPVVKATTTVNVGVSVSLNQILDLVEKNQTLITQLWIEEEWVDETLRWNPRSYGNLMSIVVPSAQVWLPDIYIFNNADRGDEGFVSLNESRVLVRYDGHVTWIVPLIVHSACAVDVTYFPFDEQRCFVRFGSWIYDENQVNLTLKDTAIKLDSYSVNTELDLLQVGIERESTDTVAESRQISAFSATTDGGATRNGNDLSRSGSHIIVSLSIRRKPLYYGYTIVAPTLVLCALNLFSFLLPCDNGDKVGIGLTVFLSLYVLQLAIAENIPESNTLPLIGVFLTLVMTLNAVSLVCATVVINVKKKSDLLYCPPVPRLILSFCRTVLGRLTCTSFSDVDYGDPTQYLAPCRSATVVSVIDSFVADTGATDIRPAAIIDINGETGANRSNRRCSTTSTINGVRRLSLTVPEVPDVVRPTPSTAGDDYFRLKPPTPPSLNHCNRKSDNTDDELTDDHCRRLYGTSPVREDGPSFDCRHFLQPTQSSLSSSLTGQQIENRSAMELKEFTPVVLATSVRTTAETSATTSAIRRRSSAFSTHEAGGGSEAERRRRRSSTFSRVARYEWCYVAETLDKTLFLLFLTAMLSTVIVSLVIVPYCHRSS